MPGYDIFLSYSRTDAAAAGRLRARLDQDAGLKTFLDRYALPGGKPWQPELEAALASCRALVVLLGPAGIGGWQHREIQLGLDRQTAAAKTATPFPVIPVLLPGLQPDDVPLGTFLALNTWVDLRTGLDEPEPLQRLIAAAQGRAIDGLTRDLAGLRPYRGLLPFREQDAGLFFGRQRFVEELVAKVRQRSATNLVAVLGRSGSGKSSIVFAGLFPALRKERGTGQQAVWQILDLRPGAEPLHALIETLDPPDESLSRTQKLALINAGVDLLRQRKVTLAQLVRDRLKDDPGTTRLLLYVDQWEELYTQAQPREPKSDEDKARTADARLFTDLVLDAAAISSCTLVLSVRSDFYPDLQTHDRLRAAVQHCQVSLGPMTKAELTAAIEGPAKALGGSVEPELIKKLLRDIGLDPANPGADHYDIGKLPLLEHSLDQAWAKAKDGRLGLAHYAGLEQELEDRANDIYDRLSEQHQVAAKRLFVSLVTPGEGREDTRAKLVLGHHSDLAPAAEAFAAGNARLVVTSEDAGARSVEVSHEALIRHWERLRGWVDENRANMKMRAELVAARVEWLSNAKDKTLLVQPGLRLEAARRLRVQPGDVIVADLVDYLDASIASEARRRRWRTAGFALLVAIAVAMTGLAGFSMYQYAAAKARADEKTAALIWSRLDFKATDTPRSPVAIRALWQLAGESTNVRQAFLDTLVSISDQKQIYLQAPQIIARSFGLKPAAVQIPPLLFPLLQQLANSDDIRSLLASDQTISVIARKLPHAEVERALDFIVELLISNPNPFNLELLTKAFLDVWIEIPSSQTLGISSIIVDHIGRSTDPWRLQAYSIAIGRAGLSETQAYSAVDHILHVLCTCDIDYSFDPQDLFDFQMASAFDALAKAVEVLAPFLGQELTAGTLQHVIDALAKFPYPTTEVGTFRAAAYGKVVAALRPNASQAQIALTPVLVPLGWSHGSSVVALAEAIQVLGIHLAAEQARDAADTVTAALIRAYDREEIGALAGAISTLSADLSPKQAQAAAESIMVVLARVHDPGTIRVLIQVLKTLRPGIWQPVAVIHRILDQSVEYAEEDVVRSMVDLIEELRPDLTPEQTRIALVSIIDELLSIDQLLSTYDPYRPRYLAELAHALGPSTEQLERASVALNSTMSHTMDPFNFIVAAHAAQIMRPDIKLAPNILEVVLAELPRTTDVHRLEALAAAMQTAFPLLTAEKAQLAIEQVKSVLSLTSDPGAAEVLARALASVLPTEPLPAYIASLIELLKWPTTAGPATDALLEVLYERVPGAPGKDAGLNATVEWVAATYPDIDLDSPPTFPASTGTGNAP